MAKKELIKQTPKLIETPKEKEFELIRWDNNTKVYFGVIIPLFLFCLVFKIHFSNIPIWYQVFGEQGKIKKEVIFGQPQTIRSDEWMMGGPLFLSQLHNNFPIQNVSAGGESSALVLGLPVNKIYDFFRPQLYLYHVLDKERAFSVMYLTKTFFLLSFFFLFLKVVTKNSFWVSFLCTFMMFTTSIIQWWSVYSEFVYLGSAIFLSFVYLLYSKEKWITAISAWFLTCFTFSYLIFLYPPYQVPCTIGFIIVVIYFVKENFKLDLIRVNLLYKGLGLLFVVLTLGYLLFDYYNATKSTYDLVLNTVYPGKRDSTTDGHDFSKLFSEYLFYFVTPESFPARWGNISEASGCILLFPVVMFNIIYNFITKKKNNILVILLIVYEFFLVFHLLVGFPGIINKLTLNSFVPTYRASFGIGIINIILLAVFLSSEEYKKTDLKSSSIFAAFSVVFVAVMVILTNNSIDGFFKSTQVTVSIIVFSALYFASFMKDFVWAQVVLFIIILGYNFPNLKANPISKGIKPFTSQPLYGQVNDIYKSDKEAKWIVFGNFIFSAFAKSTGAPVISGVNFVPDFDRLKVLDPLGKKDSIYNRYAHVSYNPFVDGKDSVVMQLVQADAYHVYMDPSSDRIKKMGVKYLLFTYNPQPVEVRNLELVNNNVFPIYKIKN